MKIKVVFLVIIIILSFELSCSIPVEKTNTAIVPIKENCSTVSSETAILIAKGYLFLDYDLRNHEAKVETEIERWKDKGEMWKVALYSLEDGDTYNEAIVVWIFKDSGRVFTVKHQK